MASSDKKSITIRSQITYRLSYHGQRTEGNTYECHACKQGGCGPYYSRNGDSPKRYYHPYCGKLLRCDSSSATPVRKHPLYPTRNLVLKETEPSKVQPCVVCGNDVQKLRYEWRHKKAQGSRNTYGAFHPLCASLSPQIGGSPEHGIVLQLEERIRGECLICKGNSIDSKGWAYNSTTGNYCCHVWCMNKKIMESLRKKEASLPKEALPKKKAALPKEALPKKKASLPRKQEASLPKEALSKNKMALQLIAFAVSKSIQIASLIVAVL